MARIGRVRFGFIVLASMILPHCSPPSAKHQATDQLQEPPFSGTRVADAQGLPLIPGTNAVGAKYNGSFIVWSETATPAQIEAVSRGTQNYTRELASWLAYFADEVNPVRDRQLEAAASLSELRRMRSTLQRGALLSNAKDWFEGAIGSSDLGFDDVDFAASRKGFAAWCEAKIWEAAVQRDILESLYTARPSPSALCEGVYAARGLLDRSSSLCADNSAGQGYFSCFWREGVLKTSLMTRIQDESRLSAIASVPDTVLVEELRTLRPNRSILRQLRTVTIGVQVVDFSFPNQSVPVATDATWETAPAQMILDAFARSSSDLVRSDGLRLVSWTSRERSDSQKQQIEALRATLRFFTDKINQGAVNEPVSVRDGDVASQDAQGCDTVPPADGVDPIEGRGREAACALTNVATDLDGSVVEAESQEASLAAQLKELEAIGEGRREAVETALRGQQNAATEPGVAVVLLPFARTALRAVRGFDDTLVVGLNLNDSASQETPTTSCAWKGAQDSVEACFSRLGGESPRFGFAQGAAVGSLVEGVGSGLITWTIPLDDPEALGIVARERVGRDPDFVELSPESVKGLTLRLHLAPVLWGGLVRGLSGKVTFERPETGEIIYAGRTVLVDTTMTRDQVRRSN